jgi:16S rRNA (guanine527-N7)-methyltransferase
LPGIVLAIVCPHAEIALVEVRRNRAVFLHQAVTELGLPNVSVYPRRAETLRERRDVCLARAFAPAPASWSVAEPLLARPGRLIYWGGVGFDPGADLPDGVAVSLFRTPALARSGPLVIMSRQ